MRAITSGEAQNRIRAPPRAEEHRPLDSEPREERAQVARPLLDVPPLGRRDVAPAAAPQVDIEHLRGAAEHRPDVLLVGRVVGARPGVDDHHRWRLAQPGAVGTQLGALEVSEQPGSVDSDPHRWSTLAVPGIRKRNWSQ
jgi:hypothetical protein